VDPVLERPGVPHDRSPGVGVHLLQDPHRTRELLDGPAVPGCHPAVRLPDDGVGRIRRVPAPARTVPVAGSARRENGRRAALPYRPHGRAGVRRVDVRGGDAANPPSRGVRRPHSGRRAAREAVRSTRPPAVRAQVLVGRARAGHAPRLHLREERAAVFVAPPGPGRSRTVPGVGNPVVRTRLPDRRRRAGPGVAVGRHHAGPQFRNTNLPATRIRARSARRSST
jgi:hypothetical protein